MDVFESIATKLDVQKFSRQDIPSEVNHPRTNPGFSCIFGHCIAISAGV